jgi:hypothetical protein
LLAAPDLFAVFLSEVQGKNGDFGVVEFGLRLPLPMHRVLYDNAW